MVRHHSVNMANMATYDRLMGLLGDLGEREKCRKLVEGEKSFWGAFLYNQEK